jgi:hypothetical protein
MTIDLNFAASAVAAFAAVQSAFHARRSTKLTELALRNSSYAQIETLPSAEILGVVDVNGKHRAKLIIFNQRSRSFRIHCVKCFRYDPKKRNLKNWMRRKDESFDWNFTEENAFWNPKGTLDDDEHYAETTLPFTLVRDTEIVLVTVNGYATNRHQLYKFKIITSQGITVLTGTLPNSTTTLPTSHTREIR